LLVVVRPLKMLKFITSAGVFVRAVRAFKLTISWASRTPNMIKTYLKRRKSHSHQKIGPERDFYEWRQRTEEMERAFKLTISWASRTPNIIKTYLKRRKSHSHQRSAQREIFTSGGNAQKKQNANGEKW
jgi:hypothetical protein